MQKLNNMVFFLVLTIFYLLPLSAPLALAENRLVTVNNMFFLVITIMRNPTTELSELVLEQTLEETSRFLNAPSPLEKIVSSNNWWPQNLYSDTSNLSEKFLSRRWKGENDEVGSKFEKRASSYFGDTYNDYFSSFLNHNNTIELNASL